MNLDYKTALVLVGGVVAAYFILRNDAVALAKATGKAIDPTSTNNVFYKTVSAATPTGSLGSWVYDLFHTSKQ